MCIIIAPATGPIEIVVTDITSTEFSVNWLPPAYSDRNGIIRSYSIMLTGITNNVSISHSVSSSVTLLQFQGLHPAYYYGLKIAATTISQGPYSELIQVQMAEDGKFHHVTGTVAGSFFIWVCLLFSSFWTSW